MIEVENRQLAIYRLEYIDKTMRKKTRAAVEDIN